MIFHVSCTLDLALRLLLVQLNYALEGNEGISRICMLLN